MKTTKKKVSVLSVLQKIQKDISAIRTGLDVLVSANELMKSINETPAKNPQTFFKELFNLDVPEPDQTPGFISLPMPKGLTCDQIYAVMKTKFTCYSYYDSIDAAIKIQQDRPDQYIFTFKDSIEPDTLNKSYNDFHEDGQSYMIPKEGLLAFLYVFWLRGEMLDVKGITRFHALDSDGDVLLMRRSGNGQFSVSHVNRGDRNSVNGPRQSVFKPY